MTAESITAPRLVLTLGGEERTLIFDHEQIRQTELCWQGITGNVMGYLGILAQCRREVYCALCALAFGALASGERDAGIPTRERTPFARFDRAAEYHELIRAAGELYATALSALPAPEDDAKNP